MAVSINYITHGCVLMPECLEGDATVGGCDPVKGGNIRSGSALRWSRVQVHRPSALQVLAATLFLLCPFCVCVF